MMRLTKEGLALIKSFEGCRLTAYYDGGVDEHGIPHGKLTIGWGHTRGVFEHDECTQEAADQWLLEDLAELERALLQCFREVELNDNQLSALISFCYNVGFGRADKPGRPGKDGLLVLASGHPSAMCSLLRYGFTIAVADEFPKWARSSGAESAGLLRRRLAEQALYRKEPNACKRLIKALNPLNLLRQRSKP